MKQERPQNANLKPWKKGQSGNPGGKPIGAVSVTNALLKQLQEPQVADTIAKAMIAHIVDSGNAGIAKLFLDRTEGPVDSNINLVVDSNKQIIAALQAFKKVAGEEKLREFREAMQAECESDSEVEE